MNYDEGKATRASAIHGVVESQRTERYQAVDCVPDLDRRIAWGAVLSTAWPFLMIGVWVVAGALWTVLPWGVQAVVIASTPIAAIAAVWQAWAGRVR